MLTKEIWKELRLIDEIVHNTSIVYGEDEITYRWVIDIFLLNFCYLRRKKFVFDANSLWYQMNLTAGLSRQILMCLYESWIARRISGHLDIQHNF